MTANNQLQNQLQSSPLEVPPQAVALAIDPVPLEVRKLRVANGSRRKRDLAAVGMAEELEQLERLGQREQVEIDWTAIVNRLWQAVPDSTFAIWLAPLRPAGAAGSTAFLSAPDEIRTWVNRRYLPLIREALQATGSDYAEVELIPEGSEW